MEIKLLKIIRSYIGSILLFVLLSSSLFAQKKPNVIVIMTDDMGNNIANLGFHQWKGLLFLLIF